MKGQGPLATIFLAFLALGVVIFVFSNLRPSSQNEGGQAQPVTNPVEYAEKARLGTPSATAKEITASILQAAGVEPTGAGTVATGTGYEIRYLGPSRYVSWAEFSVFITADTSDGIVAAHEAAEQWFLDQGYKPQDLCSGGMPVTFSLVNKAGVQALEASGQSFSRIPSFCSG